MVNCVVTGNSAPTGLGGGIYIRANCHPDIINTVITKNQGYSGGAGVYCYQSHPVLTNVTLCNNELSQFGPGGAGLYCSESSPVLTNTIIWGNTGGDSSQVYLADASSDPGFVYCNISGSQASFSGPGSGPVYGGTYDWNISRPPLLGDTANGDFRLSGVSPCLNRGTPDTTGLACRLLISGA